MVGNCPFLGARGRGIERQVNKSPGWMVTARIEPWPDVYSLGKIRWPEMHRINK